MRDIICFEHIRHMATIVRAKEVLDKNQDLVFGNKVDLTFLKDWIEKMKDMPYCKNCEHRFECKSYLERKEKNNELI